MSNQQIKCQKSFLPDLIRLYPICSHLIESTFLTWKNVPLFPLFIAQMFLLLGRALMITDSNQVCFAKNPVGDFRKEN